MFSQLKLHSYTEIAFFLICAVTPGTKPDYYEMYYEKFQGMSDITINPDTPEDILYCLCSYYKSVRAPSSLCSTCLLQPLLLCKEPTFPSTLQCLPLPSQWK